MPCRVIRIEKPAPDVAILHLQLPANDPLRYHAGQYVEFILQGGARRSYSMANAPHTRATSPRSSCTCAICRAACSPTTCSAR
jgi:CDP-4-dehydro-6-deoxyglucose reductase